MRPFQIRSKSLPLSLLALVALLAGCVSTRPLRTSSGLPEAVLRDNSPERIEPILLGELEKHGFQPVHVSPRILIVQRDIGDADTALRYGKGWNTSGLYRVTCSLTDHPRGMHVLLEIQIVTDPGEKDQAVKDAPPGLDVAHELQDVLETVQGTVALQTHSRMIERMAEQEQKEGPAHAPVWQGSERD